MCGILGIKYFNSNKKILKNKFCQLLGLINHRGPDNVGFFENQDFICGINRLKIIDKENGNQPMFSECGRYVLIFNGEIYNYKELRFELLNSGYKFKTSSDTEVLLNAFLKYGTNCFEKFNGMFAIAIYDNIKKELLLSRDRFGKKPLYIYRDEDLIFFSSEIKPIIQSEIFKCEINYESIYDLFFFWYINEPKTIIKKINQLKPGCFLKISKSNFVEERQWWSFNFTQRKIKFKDASEELEDLLIESIKLRLNSDVSVGTMLSGGIDSGLVSSIYSKIYENGFSYTLDFKEKSYSEYNLTKTTADKNNLILKKVNYIESPSIIENVLKEIDEPLGNASLIAAYQIFNFIKKDKTSVILTGDGGDELFGGYPTYQSVYLNKIFQVVPNPIFNLFKKLINFLPVSQNRISFEFKAKKLLEYIKNDVKESHPRWREITSIKKLKSIIKSKILDEIKNYDPIMSYNNSYDLAKNLDLKNQLMFGDFQNFLLSDHLRKIDRASMLNSVEARCPFLDYRIVNFAFSISSTMKINAFKLKLILKEIGKKYLDKSVINSKKLGLTPPINYWILDYFKEKIFQIINSEKSIIANLFKKKELENIVEYHFKKKVDYSRFLWTLITLDTWFENNKKYINL